MAEAHRYRRRPHEVEAMRLTPDSITEVIRWLESHGWRGYHIGVRLHISESGLNQTITSVELGNGDWVILDDDRRGGAGVYYVPAGAFESMYAEIPDATL